MNDDSSRFARDLFGSDWPAASRLAIWEKGTKRSTYVEAGGDLSRFKGGADVYLGVALSSGSMAATRRPGAADAVAIGGVWADVDVNGGPEGKTHAAPSVDDARKVIESMGSPTLLVGSGYGLQAWWCLEDIWVFGSDAEREQAGRVVHGWQAMLRKLAEKHGWKIDATHDLARLMRLPGTVNGKGGLNVPVTLIEGDGPRYDLPMLARWATAEKPTARTTSPRRVAVDSGEIPAQKFAALMHLSPEFAATWDRETTGRRARWSQSEYDLSLASQALRAEWTDAEATALIRGHRERWGENEKKSTRMGYLDRTIRKAKEGMADMANEMTEIQELEQQQAAAEEKQKAATERLAEARRLAERSGLLDQASAAFGTIGGPAMDSTEEMRCIVYAEWDELLELPEHLRCGGLTQQGETIEDARFILSLGARPVNVGTWADLSSLRRLHAVLVTAVGHLPLTVRKEDQRWRRALRALVAIRTHEEPLGHEMAEWVAEYCEERAEGDLPELTTLEEVGAAYDDHKPWQRAGEIYVPVGDLRSWLMAHGLPSKRSEIRLSLKAVGLESRIVGRLSAAGKQSTGRYWAGKLREGGGK